MDEEDDQFLLKSRERHRGLQRLPQNGKAKIKHQNAGVAVTTIFFPKISSMEKKKRTPASPTNSVRSGTRGGGQR